MNKSDIYKKIKKIFEEDQADRNNKELKKLSIKERWRIIEKKDRKRRDSLTKILKEAEGIQLRGVDYFRAGIVFQHGEINDIRLAKHIASKGIKKNHKSSRWLYAAATDRILIMEGKKQKFGTQFGKDRDGFWVLLPVDNKTTDSERREYGVQSLTNIKKTLDKLNKNSDFTNRLGLTRM